VLRSSTLPQVVVITSEFVIVIGIEIDKYIKYCHILYGQLPGKCRYTSENLNILFQLFKNATFRVVA
jgi:hypothetical protein